MGLLQSVPQLLVAVPIKWINLLIWMGGLDLYAYASIRRLSLTLDLTVPLKNADSCGMIARDLRSSSSSIFPISTPSILMHPPEEVLIRICECGQTTCNHMPLGEIKKKTCWEKVCFVGREV